MEKKYVILSVISLLVLSLATAHKTDYPVIHEPTTSSVVSTENVSPRIVHHKASRTRRIALPKKTVVKSVQTSKKSVEPSNYSNSLSLAFDKMAGCESSHNPRAVNPSGKYRGAFQFDLTTWHEVGMPGDPVDYSYEAQKAAAIKLYHLHGAGRWPECGRYLP